MGRNIIAGLNEREEKRIGIDLPKTAWKKLQRELFRRAELPETPDAPDPTLRAIITELIERNLA